MYHLLKYLYIKLIRELIKTTELEYYTEPKQ